MAFNLFNRSKKDQGAGDSQSAKAQAKKRKSQHLQFVKMKLDETVADTVYSDIDDIYNSDEPSAIVRTDEGYLIVALLDEELNERVEFGSPDFGSFSTALKSGDISNVRLKIDIDNGILGIIPDQQTLEELEEFEFIESDDSNVEAFHFALVTPDLSEDEGLKVFEETISLADLFNVMNGHTIVNVDGDNIELVKKNKVVEEAPVEEELFDDVAFEQEEVYAESPVYDTPQEYVPETPAPIYEEPVYQEPAISYQEPVYEEPVYHRAAPSYEPINPVAKASEVYEMQQQFVDSSLLDTDLRLTVNEADFDDLFLRDDMVPELFSEEVYEENNHLASHVRMMSVTANTDILHYRDENLNHLRQRYVLGMRKFINELTSKLDLTTSETVVGSELVRLEDWHRVTVDNAQREVDASAERMRKDYEEKRDSWVATQVAALKEAYDEDHIEDFDRKAARERTSVTVEADREFVRKRKKLLSNRAEFAKQAISRASTSLLSELLKDFTAIREQEYKLYGKWTKEIDTYIKDNMEGEIIRAKALRDELNRGEDLRDLELRYKGLLAQKESELANSLAEADSKIATLRKEQEDEIALLADEHETALRRAVGERERAEQRYDELNDRFMALDNTKEEKFQHQISVAEDMNKALRMQLDQAAHTQARQSKTAWIVAATIGILALGGGLLGGLYAGNLRAQDLHDAQMNREVVQYKESLSERDESIEALKKSQAELEARIADADAKRAEAEHKLIEAGVVPPAVAPEAAPVVEEVYE